MGTWANDVKQFLIGMLGGRGDKGTLCWSVAELGKEKALSKKRSITGWGGGVCTGWGGGYVQNGEEGMYRDGGGEVCTGVWGGGICTGVGRRGMCRGVGRRGGGGGVRTGVWGGGVCTEVGEERYVHDWGGGVFTGVWGGGDIYRVGEEGYVQGWERREVGEDGMYRKVRIRGSIVHFCKPWMEFLRLAWSAVHNVHTCLYQEVSGGCGYYTIACKF